MITYSNKTVIVTALSSQNMKCSSHLFLMYRLTAIECVMTLAQVHSDADRDDIVFRHQVGDVIMFFLPGIVSGLQRIATDDEKQGHQITMVYDWVLSFEVYAQLGFNFYSLSPVILVLNLIHLNISSL
jgi:hypothetical protein